jgi:PncC family amidohydrolase
MINIIITQISIFPQFRRTSFMIGLAERLGQVLKERNWTICAAESCTGGLILSSLTDVSGSSAYVLGGIVTYSNQAKMQFVGVRESTLQAYGAVSEQTAIEMAIGVRQAFNADLAISVTGIAGPGGGSPEKPVGLVYIAVMLDDEVYVRRYLWQGNRVENKVLSVEAALNYALELLNA